MTISKVGGLSWIFFRFNPLYPKTCLVVQMNIFNNLIISTKTLFNSLLGLLLKTGWSATVACMVGSVGEPYNTFRALQQCPSCACSQHIKGMQYINKYNVSAGPGE